MIKIIFSLLILAVLGASLFTGLNLIQNKQVIKSRASSETKQISLDQLNLFLGLSVTSPHNPSNLEINRKTDAAGMEGVYEIKAKQFACPPRSSATCEPDRFEIRFSENISPIYGLGRLVGGNTIEVNDFLDTSFANGHIVTPEKGLDFFESDIGRMRTPMLVLPTKKLIIAYLQPAVKAIRVSRKGEYGCPNGQTCLVFKKQNLYPEGGPAPLVFIRGSSMADAYSRYYHYLKDDKNFFFKKPHYKTFGVNWETWDEFLCQPTHSGVRDIVSRYEASGIKLSSITLGSGYWGAVGNNPENLVGCGTPEVGSPATDSLTVSSGRFNGLPGISSLFNDLNAKGIYPLIGMRHQIQLGNVSLNNIDRISKIFNQKGVTSGLYFDDTNYYGTNGEKKVKFLNLSNNTVINAWFDILKENYGPFKGFKEDEMQFVDQKSSQIAGKKQKDDSAINLFDDLFCLPYRQYSQKTNNDFLIIGSSSWFSVCNDGQSVMGWLPSQYKSDFPGYAFKDFLDTALSQVVSGYPHPKSELSAAIAESNIFNNNLDIPENKRKEFTRLQEVAAFFPVTLYSRGFWHVCPQNDSLCQKNYQTAVVYFAKLRNRLQQYAYDQAQRWFEEGIPYAMQPLFIRFPDEPDAYKQYRRPDNPSLPIDEYMFGNALLVRPLLSNDDTVNVYLPKGNWKAMTTGKIFNGGANISYTLSNNLDFPWFLKEGEILILGHWDNPDNLMAYTFLGNTNESAEYKMYQTSGSPLKLKAIKENGNVVLKNLTNGKVAAMADDQFNKGFKVAFLSSILP